MWRIARVNQLTCRSLSSAFKGLRESFIAAHAKCATQAGAPSLGCSANLLARLAGVESRQLPLLMAHERSEGRVRCGRAAVAGNILLLCQVLSMSTNMQVRCTRGWAHNGNLLASSSFRLCVQPVLGAWQLHTHVCNENFVQAAATVILDVAKGTCCCVLGAVCSVRPCHQLQSSMAYA